jgi:methyl-accepting chemotaxis protein
MALIMKAGLATKFILPTLFLVAVGVSVIGVIGYMASSSAIEKYSAAALSVAAQSLARSADLWVDARALELNGIVDTDGAVKSLGEGFLAIGARKSLSERLVRLQKGLNLYSSIMLVNPQLQVVAHSSTTDTPTIQALLSSEMQQAVKDMSPAVFHGFQHQADQAPSSLFVVPVLASGKTIGTLVALVDWSYFKAGYIAPAKVSGSAQVLGFNTDGELLMDSDDSKAFSIDAVQMGLNLPLSAADAVLNRLYQDDFWISRGAVSEATGYTFVVSEKEAAVMQEAKNGVLFSVITGLGIMVAVTLALLAVTRTVLKPIMVTVNALKGLSMGGGDLTKRLRVSTQDEVGELANYFNQFISSLDSLVGKAKIATTEVVKTSNGMDRVVTTSRQLVESQKSETLMIASAVNQLASSSLSVSETATKAAAFTKDAEDKVVEGNLIVQESVRLVRELVNDVANSAASITRLGEASTNIGTVVEVINSIAEQTNLLALNAAIEAARAGEMGRGFAVVADEVRTLAKRTQDSVEEIKKMIHVLQSESDIAQQAFQRSSSHSSQTVQQTESTITVLNGIIAAISSINEINQGIALASNEQSSVTEEVNAKVTSIHQMADETAENAERLFSESRTLKRASESLESVVNNFTVSQ